MLGLATVEGIATVRVATQLVRKVGARTPLLHAIAACLNAKRPFARPFQRYLRTLSFDSTSRSKNPVM